MLILITANRTIVFFILGTKMEQRLKSLIKEMENYCESEKLRSIPTDERIKKAQALLIQIQLLQHERLIHLIVTITFAILTMLSIILTFIAASVFVMILCALFIILLIPYIRHYYILENGVQRLYGYYDFLCADF